MLHTLVFCDIWDLNFSNQEIRIYVVNLFNSPMTDSNCSSGMFLSYSTLLSCSVSSFFELLYCLSDWSLYIIIFPLCSFISILFCISFCLVLNPSYFFSFLSPFLIITPSPPTLIFFFSLFFLFHIIYVPL